MKVRVKSTGQIIDVPDTVGARIQPTQTMQPTQPAQTGMISQPTQTGTAGGLGTGTNQLQQLLSLGAIGKGQYGTAWNILQPSQEEAGLTGAEKGRTQSGLSAITEIGMIPKSTLKRTGTFEALGVNFKLNFAGGVGRPLVTEKESDLADLEQKYFLLVQSVMTAIQGSRPSDYDVRSWQNRAGPSIMFKNHVNEKRIKTLFNFLNARLQSPTATANRPPLSSFEE